MTLHHADTSPLRLARAAGLLYVVLLVCGPFSMMFVPMRLIVPGDAAATAAAIQGSEWLFRLSFASDALVFLSEIVLTGLIYVLFRPVSRTLALVAAASRLAMAGAQAANLLFNTAALVVLGSEAYRTAAGADQTHALAMVFLDAHSYGVHVWEAIFGLHCFVLGYLLLKSSFFPRLLGALMMVAAIGYLTNSFGNFLLPGHEALLAGLVGVGALLGEFPFMFWLLFRTPNAHRWHELNGSVAVRSRPANTPVSTSV